MRHTKELLNHTLSLRVCGKDIIHLSYLYRTLLIYPSGALHSSSINAVLSWREACTMHFSTTLLYSEKEGNNNNGSN